jgi:hypothetical protein
MLLCENDALCCQYIVLLCIISYLISFYYPPQLALLLADSIVYTDCLYIY